MFSLNPTPRVTACLLLAFALFVCLWRGRTVALDRQRSLSEFSRQTWLTENGLPQNTVHDRAQTPDGYIWAASDEGLARYVVSVVLRLVEVELSRQIGALRSRVQRLDADDPASGEAFAELLAAETRRRTLRDRITGT